MTSNLPRNFPRHIVIVGGGTAGWMAANLIAHQLGRFGVTISLIESPQINTVGVGEGSTPYLKVFFDQMGIDESQWMAACNASYKCGISFPGWSTVEGHRDYFHPFYGDSDATQARPFFSNCDKRRRGMAAPVLANDYFVCGILAQRQKAPHHSTSTPREGAISYGYHFDAALLGQYLKQHAIGLGVRYLEATINQIHQDSKGNIAIVETAEFGPLRGDFFVDCSGFNGLLIRQTLGATMKSYKSRLFNDSAVAIQTPFCQSQSQSLSSETISKAISHGWVWHIPLQNRTGNGYVYDSNYISNEQAETQLRQLLGQAAEGQKALHLHWQPGRLENHWLNNCVAIGLSQGFLEPLEAPMLFIIQRSIEQFIALLLEGGDHNDKRQAFDQTINTIIDGTVDYLQGHYKLNSRSDSQYWCDARNNPQMSETLSQLLDGWKANEDFDALLHRHQDKLAYLKTSWYCMLAGKGYFNDITQADSGSAQQAYVQAKAQATEQAAGFHDHWHYLTQILPLQDHS